MTHAEILRICKQVNNGARLLVGRDYVGNARLKVVRGPFGLFVSRYACSPEDLARLQQALAAQDAARSGRKLAKRPLTIRPV